MEKRLDAFILYFRKQNITLGRFMDYIKQRSWESEKICSLILFAITVNFTGFSLAKTSDVSKNILGFDDGEEYVSMWVHVIEETTDG